MKLDENGLWQVAFDGDMILDRRFYRYINRWVHENGTERRSISRASSTAWFVDETDALLCLMSHR